MLYFEHQEAAYELAKLLLEVLPQVYQEGDFHARIRLQKILAQNGYVIPDPVIYDVYATKNNCEFGIEVEATSKLSYEPNFVKLNYCDIGVFVIISGMRDETIMQRLENHEPLGVPCLIISKHGIWLWWHGIHKDWRPDGSAIRQGS